MSATTDIPGMDRPLEAYVERRRRRLATACVYNRRLVQQARQDAGHIAAFPVDLKPLEALVPHVRDRILEHGVDV